jgi:tetratricopeptide (TPR) repeat protein
VVRIPGASDFELGHELGHGGMGVVWEARQRSLDRAVALKTLRPGLEGGMAAERFAAEALVVGRLEHPNIVPVHTYGLDEGGHPYLCMKVVRGVEWARLLEPATEAEYDAFAALFLLARGEEHAARERLVAGVRKNPRSPHVFPLLAYLAARRGDRELARDLESHAREQNAAYARCYLDLDPVNRTLARAPAPGDVLGRAFVLEQDLAAVAPPEPSRGATRSIRGAERFAAGDHEAALALARRALADDATDGRARLLRARCLARSGFAEPAVADLALVPALAPAQAAEAGKLLGALGREGSLTAVRLPHSP